MAERKGSEGDGDGHDPVGSDQQDDRSRTETERDTPVGSAPSDESESSDDLDGGSEAPESVSEPDRQTAKSEQDGIADGEQVTEQTSRTEQTADGTAKIVTFRGRADESDATEATGEYESEQPDAENADPVDLSALQADDELLDVLGGTDPDIALADTDEPALESLLVAWRRDVDATPIGELVDTDTAVSAIDEGRARPRRRKRRHLVPVATAAAVLMITFTGVGVAARDALPGDALWGVAQVLYADHAQSAQAAWQAKQQLDKAGTAWEKGRPEAAREALEQAREEMHTVDAEHGLSDLQAAHASLSAKIERGQENVENLPVASSSSTQPGMTSSTRPSSTPLVPPPPSGSTQPTHTGSGSPSTSSSNPSGSASRSSSSSTGSSDRSTSDGSSSSDTGDSGLFPP
ncbi:anti-sigma-D factor RsdA-like protein [Halopolyspora algeriensis]|uniref:Anti-sigma-D factor RsdA-like protein n=1 Tax=Halopolyspora algeriensis TaxID=1500506 RepID=A0A368VZ86_9ACTN|nr:anti-sigma-D factor RsdA [Halopolyspora algeriensis]RCW46692.1 anti-sigma-D factor RsdA-like protein [Halopolyspora algeriensis]TQM46717.1 anti-sigma-D factor RsdA-like protein [Halopolyspora algeriensis]